jgi:hypothetical protein
MMELAASFRILNFVLVSNFEIRISNFEATPVELPKTDGRSSVPRKFGVAAAICVNFSDGRAGFLWGLGKRAAT